MPRFADNIVQLSVKRQGIDNALHEKFDLKINRKTTGKQQTKKTQTLYLKIDYNVVEENDFCHLGTELPRMYEAKKL